VFVIPAEAGIQEFTGCRIKPGMTQHCLFTRRVNEKGGIFDPMKMPP